MDQFTDQFTYIPALYINYVPPSSQDITKNNSQTYQSKALNKDEVVRDEPDSGEFISSSKFWKDSKTRALLSFLAENFDMYHKNKTKFYASATIEIGNNRTSNQWPYLDEINKLFGNRENVNPDYLVSSISDDNNK
ncbi:17380_t:CDS:2, partial [Cetraspora pellucida]